jgi:rod shape-determining protein MreC
VRDERTGENAILVGNNDIANLSLINLPKTASIAVGDLLVTSGLGRRYPEGYPVGRVTKVIDDTDDDFVRVSVNPVANLNRSRLVLLIWPPKDNNQLTEEIEKRFKALVGLT